MTSHACSPTGARRCRSVTSRTLARSARRARTAASSAPTPTDQSRRTGNLVLSPQRHLAAAERPRQLQPWARCCRVLASETVCKPSSVPILRSGTVIHLRRQLPTIFSGRPESEATHSRRTRARLLSYLALLRVEFARFTRARPLPACPLVSVALVLASRRTGVTRYPASGSSDFPRISSRVSPMGHATVRPSRWPPDSTLSTTRRNAFSTS